MRRVKKMYLNENDYFMIITDFINNFISIN